MPDPTRAAAEHFDYLEDEPEDVDERHRSIDLQLPPALAALFEDQ